MSDPSRIEPDSVQKAIDLLKSAGLVASDRGVQLSGPAQDAITAFLWRRTVAIATIALLVGTGLGSLFQGWIFDQSIEQVIAASKAVGVAEGQANSAATTAKEASAVATETRLKATSIVAELVKLQETAKSNANGVAALLASDPSFKASVISHLSPQKLARFHMGGNEGSGTQKSVGGWQYLCLTPVQGSDPSLLLAPPKNPIWAERSAELKKPPMVWTPPAGRYLVTATVKANGLFYLTLFSNGYDRLQPGMDRGIGVIDAAMSGKQDEVTLTGVVEADGSREYALMFSAKDDVQIVGMEQATYAAWVLLP